MCSAVLQLGNTSNSKHCFLIPTAAAAAHAVIQDGYWPMLELLLGFRSSSSMFFSLRIVCVEMCDYGSPYITHRSQQSAYELGMRVSVSKRARSFGVFFVCYVFPQC